MKKSCVFVIAGPTGSGESTITKAITETIPNITRLVTATTRLARDGEQEGIDYYFFTKERFLKEQESGNILEYTYIANRDIYYGSYKPDLERKLAAGKTVIVNPDIVGARYYKEHYHALTIFIEPDTIESLRARIAKRNPGISESELNQRLENARHELESEKPFYDIVVRNGDGKLHEAIEAVRKIITDNR